MVNSACVSHGYPSPPPTQVQYIALRNINLIVQKRSSILANEVKASAVFSLGGFPFTAAHIDTGLEATRKRVQTMEVGQVSANSANYFGRARNCYVCKFYIYNSYNVMECYGPPFFSSATGQLCTV